MTTLGLAACAPSNADKVADAQDCLDRATSDTALACLSKVDGVETAGAELVRCSAYFIDQGFSDPGRLSRVSEELKKDGNNGGGGSSTIAVLSFMAFSASKYDKTTNLNFSETAFASCQGSSSKGMIYLSSMTRIATVALGLVTLYDPTTGTPPTESQIREGLCTNATPASRAVIGSATRAAYEQNCKGKENPDPVCKEYAAAVGGGTTDEQIGSQLETNLCTP
ncbi:MAG: hypothetical protein KF767_02690 [Bdellovibrionaceae bacterium]|nr:hypothetical protein [Pseudobdellovibrionaceae bacterium]